MLTFDATNSELFPPSLNTNVYLYIYCTSIYVSCSYQLSPVLSQSGEGIGVMAVRKLCACAVLFYSSKRNRNTCTKQRSSESIFPLGAIDTCNIVIQHFPEHESSRTELKKAQAEMCAQYAIQRLSYQSV
jgi:hypothetical protein